MDLTKLTPAPWRVDPWNTLPNGYLIGPSIETLPAPVGLMRAVPPISMAMDDAEFCALARNAFDVMMRRNWHPEIWDMHGNWFVVTREGDWVTSPNGREPLYSADPFTALLAADEWYVANVEASLT